MLPKLPFFKAGALLALLFILAPYGLAKTQIHGATYLSLEELAQSLGMRVQWIEKGKKAELKSKWSTLAFKLHKRDCVYNNRRIFLGTPVTLHKNKLWITQQDYNNTLVPVLAPKAITKKQKKLQHIMLDPGHGGKDDGTKNAKLGLIEKKLSLDLALRIERILKDEGFRVSFTRKKDKFVSLGNRPKKANKQNADLFISLHFNAVGSQKEQVHGTETYILPGQNQPSTSRSTVENSDKRHYAGNNNNKHNMLLAYCIQDALLDTIKTNDRGIKKARFAVLKELQCPGVLVEGAFLSNSQEGRKVATSQYRQKMAQAIAEGIINYEKLLKK